MLFSVISTESFLASKCPILLYPVSRKIKMISICAYAFMATSLAYSTIKLTSREKPYQ